MNKAVIAVIVIIILIGLALVAVPFDGNPLYQTLTHVVVKYSATPIYASPLNDCRYDVTVKAFKDYKSIFQSVNVDKEQVQTCTCKASVYKHKLLEFVEQYVENYNFTLTLNITIIDNSTKQLIYQRILNIFDLYDKEIHIYRRVTEIRPCTYVKIYVQLHVEFDYQFIGNVTIQPIHFSKTITKERIIHVEMSPTQATEYQLYTKET